MGDEEEPKVGVSWMQVAGSALAAVSSAVVLSTLGVAGTVIGAAVGSVVATLGTALYTRTLDASRQQVAAQAAALRRVTRARSELDEAVAARRRGAAVSTTGIARAERELDAAEEVLASDTAAEPPAAGAGSGAHPGPRRTAGLPSAVLARFSWQRLALAAASVFLVAMLAITAFEVVAGRAVSELTGGSDTPTRSTVPGLGRDRPEPRPSEGAPGEGPDAPELPSDDPSEEPTPPEDEPEEPTPDAEPSVEPSATPSPSPSPSPGLTEAPTEAPSSTPGDAAGDTAGDTVGDAAGDAAGG